MPDLHLFGDGEQIKRCEEPVWRPGPVCVNHYVKDGAIITLATDYAYFGAPGASWMLTAAISPRPSVRVAVADAYGDVQNRYPAHRRVDGKEPTRPWAMYLADTSGRFRFLGFDLDAKSPDAAAAAARDADVIAGLLTDAGIQHVVCESGPSHGRHVWAALSESVDAPTIATLAHFLRNVCPTLDVVPLTNPQTGCLRPPGAPHRHGGRSTVLRGDLSTLTAPTTTAAQVRGLVEALAKLSNDAEPAGRIDPKRPIPVDEHGRLYLPGPRRQLTAGSAAALREDAASGDASAVLWRILVGAAAARWRHADIAALVDDAPGLEHVRTERDRLQRRPRGRGGAAHVLRRQWDKAVRFVATTDRQVGDDPTFDTRAAAIAGHVRDLQERADAAAGRWTHGGGPADRRALDVLCMLALKALSASLEADTRRLALLAGVGRETARTALLRLAADGWIAQTRPADGPHAAHWTIDPQSVIHSSASTSRSQADPRPAGAGSAERSILLTDLTGRIADAAHDLFTLGPGLGLHAGNVYARTTDSPQLVDAIARSAGCTADQVRSMLDRLTRAGVLVHNRHGWRRRSVDYRRAAAIQLDVDGRLEERAARYAVERELWAWWQAEETWMRAPRRTHASRRPGRGQLALYPDDGTHAYGPHPRRPDGRLDWRGARREVEQERNGVARRSWNHRSVTASSERSEVA